MIQQYLASQSGGTKALRLDMGSECGPGYLDIRSVMLGLRSEYYNTPGGFDIGRVKEELRGLISSAPGPRNAFVIVDAIYDSPSFAPSYSLAELIFGSSDVGAAAPSNRGGLFAFHFLRTDESPEYSPDGFDPTATLHEVAHNLGAVSERSPHSTLAGHCFEESDVMCYPDGGPRGQAMSWACPEQEGLFPGQFDCNKDDYFSPAPAPGSYLSTSFNLYDSVFLAPCGELSGACGNATNPPVLGKLVKRTTKRVKGGRVSLSATYAGDAQWRVEAELKPRTKIRSASLCVSGSSAVRKCAKKRNLRRTLRVKLSARADNASQTVALKAKPRAKLSLPLVP